LNQGHAFFVEVVTDSVRLRALGDQWNALWARSSEVGLFQSFEYCLDAWELIEEPKGNQLACLVGWRDDQLVAVWPFATYRNRLWTHARQLVASGVELHELLLDVSVDRQVWVQRAWGALIAHSHADVIEFSFFENSANAQALRSLPAHAVETSTTVCVSVEVRREDDWDDYYNSLSKSYRKDYAKSRRRLEALGVLELAVLEAGDPRIGPLVDWTLAQKRRWAEHTGKRGEWIYSDRYRAFLEHQLANSGASSSNVLLTLTLNGDLLATQIGALSKDKFEAVIAGFNSDYDKHSPGARLNEAMIRWAWERGVDCDLGAGNEPYKLFWSRNREVAIINNRMAVSWWGVGAFASRRAVQRLQRWRVAVMPDRGQR
jgi:CelD/BcsL family acetyltransferase involved in cellulose biosynthesis